MDYKDINGVASNIMDAVNDAVNSGDFTGLNDALRNATGAAAGTAADALHGLQEHLQGGAQGTQVPGGGGAMGGPGRTGGQSPESPQGSRTYGHAGRSYVNQTEEYRKRVSGPRHHTSFASKISPFLQRKISRSSGTGKIIGGVISFVFAGISLMETLASGLLGFFSPVGGGVLSAWSIVSLVFFAGLAILGSVLVRQGRERRELVRKYYEYGQIAGTSEYIEIGRLARAAGETRETVLNNLEKMISDEMLPAAWFDRQKTTLMLSEDMYNEYLRLERERQQMEAEEAKDRMAEKAAQGTGADASFQAVDDDLKLKPEDARLPAEARRIIEEGLLYIGRIRDFNRRIGDEEISSQLAHLEITMKRIIDQVRKDPSSASNLRRLMVYYLPTTMKLLDAYGELDRQQLEGKTIASTKQEIREALGTINEAFEKLLDSLFQDMAWDISSDISVMKTMMVQDGLTGDGIRQNTAGQRPAGRRQQSGGTENPGETAAGQTLSSEPAFADGYTEGYTEGFTEGYGQEGGVQAQTMEEPGAAEASGTSARKEEGGIRLTFGE